MKNDRKKKGAASPIRLMAILVITLTNLLIVMVSILSGTRFVSQNIEAAQETDMQVVADIADLYISNEIELLYLKAAGVSKNLAMADEARWESILSAASDEHPEFIGAAVFDVASGRIAAAGEKPARDDALKTTLIATALEGKKTLGTTYFYDPNTYYDPSINARDPNSDPGDVVFYAAVPILNSQDRLLAVTIPGMYFHEKLREFQIWETGHVFMIDSEETLVSNPRPHWVFQRGNLQGFADADTGFAGLAEFGKLMTGGGKGVGYYKVYGVPRVCAYKTVSGSQDGWSLGAVAPLPESPFRYINIGLIVAGSIGLILGIIAAIIASGFIKKPFEKVEALKAEAEENSKYKSQFLANMSHEMRTPLTSVIGLTELTLRTVQLDDETHGNLVKVYRSGETLLGLINDILDISKIEAGKFTLNPVEYDLPSMINDTITQSILYVGEKPIEFVLDITEDLPRSLHGDELRVKQILNNLLSNAFKFTKEGTVTLHVRCVNDGDSVWLTARVSDTGAGIKPDEFDKLFTLYAKMEEGLKQHDSTRRIEGTGLGLSICKKVVEMMDGNITVESEYGKGSVFTVKIRQKYVDGTTIGADVVESLKKFHYSIDKFKSEDKTRINLSYARVLVVDDNKANLDVAKGLMSLYGMKVDCVTSGQQAIDAIRDENVRYNAIFMDHMMPEMDGIEATRLIRELDSQYAKSIPIIALTANAIIGNEEIFLSKGFQAFVTKPIDLTRLDAALKQWVRNKDAEAILPEKTIHVVNRPIRERSILKKDIPGIDIDKGIAHFGSNEKVFVEVLQSYAKNTKPLLDELKDVSADSLAKYAITVHGVKGSCYGIYANAAGDEALALEMAAKEGDFDFVNANNQKFIDTALRLIEDIKNALASCETLKKPVKDKPESALLAKLLSACADYDIDEIDAAIAEIDECEYCGDDGLAVWIKESAEQGKIKSIIEKLQSMGIEAAGA